MTGKNQELLTLYTEECRQKSLDRANNKEMKQGLLGDRARGWPPGHPGFLECLKDQERKEKMFVNLT